MLTVPTALELRPARGARAAASELAGPRRQWRDDEHRRGRRHPLGRWYLVPVALWLADRLASSPVRPSLVTLAGLLSATWAGTMMCVPGVSPLWAAAGMLAWALCDRLDGCLARRQGTVSRGGAWLDAQLDELVDLGLHAALAGHLALTFDAAWPWFLWGAFVVGKYQFMHGRWIDEQLTLATTPATSAAERAGDSRETAKGARNHWALEHLRAIYHAPGNADLRWHALAVAWLAGWGAGELALTAGYFQVRWLAGLARHAHVRIGGEA